MPFRYFYRLAFFIVAGSAVFFPGCSSSPMKTRLGKNFVYNCSLELIGKNVAALDAEKICTSSHQAEMLENQAARAPGAAPVAPPPVPQRQPLRAPASEATPAVSDPYAN